MSNRSNSISATDKSNKKWIKNKKDKTVEIPYLNIFTIIK
jgi:hypothetical protein